LQLLLISEPSFRLTALVRREMVLVKRILVRRLFVKR